MIERIVFKTKKMIQRLLKSGKSTLYLTLFIFTAVIAQGCQASDASQEEEHWKIKVAVVIQDPIINGERAHKVLNTPGHNFLWNDPWQLNDEYKKTLEELSGGTVEYEFVEFIDSRDYFTILKESGELLTEERVVELLQEEDWKTLREQGTTFDYHAFISHYEFDKKRDNGEIHEVWMWTFPFGGMWESHMMGEGAFWLNSMPAENPTCSEKLIVMGLNYERDLACALESYGHRFESVMMEVYGWWDYDNKSSKEELTNWELYTAYGMKYEKFEPGAAHIGNIHFPPNGRHDYDWGNQEYINTYVDYWSDYPEIEWGEPRRVNCSDWDCSHIGYMRWWYDHLPRFNGLNHKDGRLNNWWYYVVDYDKALLLEQELSSKQ
jgi:hypothetical protein